MADDHGAPISYMALRPRTPVLASDGTQVGTVAEVRSDDDTDIFDGIVVDTSGGPRFVDAPEVAHIAERAVTLTIGPAEVERLAPPRRRRRVAGDRSQDGAGPGAGGPLRRAWNRITGR